MTTLINFVAGCGAHHRPHVAPSIKVATVKVQDRPTAKPATEFAVHPEVAAVPVNGADFGLSENGEDLDLEMRQVDADGMNNVDEMAETQDDEDMDLDVNSRQLDTTKDVHHLFKKIHYKKKRFLHKLYGHKYGYGYGGRYGRYGRGYGSPYGRGYGSPYGRRGYPYGGGYYGGYYPY